MKVVTINGNSAGDYDVAVHKFGCSDIKKAVNKGGLPRDYFVEEFETKRELWLDYNADFMENGEDGMWPIHFHNCAKDLPDGGHYGKA